VLKLIVSTGRCGIHTYAYVIQIFRSSKCQPSSAKTSAGARSIVKAKAEKGFNLNILTDLHRKIGQSGA